MRGCCWDGDERPTADVTRCHHPPRKLLPLPLLPEAADAEEQLGPLGCCCKSAGVISVRPGSNWLLLLLPRPLADRGRPHTLHDGRCCSDCSCCWSVTRLLQLLLLLPLLSCAEPHTAHLAPPFLSGPCSTVCCCCCWWSSAELSEGSGSSAATAAQAAGGLCGATAAARTAEECATWALYCTCSGVAAVAGSKLYCCRNRTNACSRWQAAVAGCVVAPHSKSWTQWHAALNKHALLLRHGCCAPEHRGGGGGVLGGGGGGGGPPPTPPPPPRGRARPPGAPPQQPPHAKH